MQDFRRLVAWQHAQALALDVYRTTRAFPSSETYGLTTQLRRTAAAVGAYVADGAGRENDALFAHFVGVANGACGEVRSHLALARDLGHLTPQSFARLDARARVVSRFLRGLRRRLVAANARAAEAGAGTANPPPPAAYRSICVLVDEQLLHRQ